jgi:hypothetical protein
MYLQAKNTLKITFTANFIYINYTVFGKREWEKDVQEKMNWKWKFRWKESDPSNPSSFISFNPPNFMHWLPYFFFIFNAF